MKSKTVKAVLAIVVLALIAWFFASPYITVNRMRAAARAHDAVALADDIDFPALKASLKSSLSVAMVREMAKNPATTDGSLGLLSTALMSAMVDRVVEFFVTPEGLSLMLEGHSPADEGLPSAGQGSAQQPADSKESRGKTTSMSYETFNRFVVSVSKKDVSEGTVDFVFIRHGLFAWKLSGIRLPS